MKETNKEYVSREVLDQVRWERDVALSQLEELGYGFARRIWMPVEIELPENEKEVEITYFYDILEERVYRTARAFHEDGTMPVTESGLCWDNFDFEEDGFVYDEKIDSYLIPEGWWEAVTFANESMWIENEVIAWKPLTKPYRGNDE